ncbi:methyltransferase domain-containing protein [Bradyrhizobium sp. 31Argb]|uniref:class I SAM-dependent methyltransferase n=1 Tax=unclassified Bradyrhizobium TaxID=2631580 RepID=UPI00249E7CDA|nr:class I SAM-dependent methyltransferase [Bradyrhizobium sp. Arg237L]MDI4238057.1 methyltransferase domain-containing protein [Bradyrhizobium sp. Arg237L]
MGRFATTVDLYEQFRPPYPPTFFREVAQRLALTKQHALIDLGTGPGLLALGFADYVGRIVAVDPEPNMLAAARQAAKQAGREVTLVESRAEDLPESIGRFDLVTIGRALHWLDESTLGPLFERLVAPGGVVAICASASAPDGRNAWLEEYTAARRTWSDKELWSESRSGRRVHRELSSLLQGTAFQAAEMIRVESVKETSVADLAQRMLTFSSSSPAVLGEKVEPMLRDVEVRLMPMSRDGVLTEFVVSTAEIVRRR